MKNIVILTGAGISAESGLDTFRGNNGMWGKYAIEEVATPEAFKTDPQKVQAFYNQRRSQLKDVNPNKAHQALAELEEKWDGEFTLITQNVDDLHERAGSKNLIHMHGELKKARCTQTHQIVECEEDLDVTTPSPFDKTGVLRPHIVWFGEVPLAMDVIFSKLDQADIFVCIGTSGNVYPASGFAQHVYLRGCETIEVNIETSEISNFFQKRLIGKATEKVPELLDILL